MSQGGLALVALDMWTAPWGRFLSPRLNPRDRLHTQGMGSSLSCRIERKGLLPPHGTCLKLQGRQMKRVSKEVFGQTDCLAAGWPEEKLAGDVVHL